MTSKALLEMLIQQYQQDKYVFDPAPAVHRLLNAAREAGYVLKPLEPTEEMQRMGAAAMWEGTMREFSEAVGSYKIAEEIYKAMGDGT